MKLNDTQLVFCPPPHSAQQEPENPRLGPRPHLPMAAISESRI